MEYLIIVLKSILGWHISLVGDWLSSSKEFRNFLLAEQAFVAPDQMLESVRDDLYEHSRQAVPLLTELSVRMDRVVTEIDIGRSCSLNETKCISKCNREVDLMCNLVTQRVECQEKRLFTIVNAVGRP